VWLLLSQHSTDGTVRAMACHALSGMLTQASRSDRVSAALLSDDSLPNLLQLLEKADPSCQVSLAAGAVRAASSRHFVSLARARQDGVLLRHYESTTTLPPTAPDDLQAEYALAVKAFNASCNPTDEQSSTSSVVTLDMI